MLIVQTAGSEASQTQGAARRAPDKPITTAQGEVAELLRTWWNEGTAAGHAGDYYDNRDGGHSQLDTSPFPQLQSITYTDEQIRKNGHMMARGDIVPHVVFGNSSTVTAQWHAGSNTRLLYGNPRGISLLYEQYTHNNIYVYPEHRDHDPGHNGQGDGYGDLFPANTPYLITSQGSSVSDRPFVQAILLTLAAFRPEVKEKLVETGLLMPTVQMVFRMTNKHLRDPAEFLSGKAHPSVFEAAWLDPLRMVQMAHAVQMDNIPPMIQLKVVREVEPFYGRDFFDPGRSEVLADTPCAICRVFRGKDYQRKLVVSAEASYDLNQKPLTWTWAVLRGDADRIQIKPLNEARSVAEIILPYHARRPVSDGSTLESNRVDIGVFAHNGTYYSAPGFITYFFLDDEARTYDSEGKIQEIVYSAGETVVLVADWAALCDVANADSPASRLLPWNRQECAALAAARDRLQTLQASAVAAEQAAKQAADASNRSARWQAAKDAAKAFEKFLNARQPAIDCSLQALVDRGIREMLRNPNFYHDHAATLTVLAEKVDPARASLVRAVRQRLVAMGILQDDNVLRADAAVEPGRSEQRTPAPQASTEQTEENTKQYTPYEQSMLELFHAILLSHVAFPQILVSKYEVNFVDPRIWVPKTWRDVYHYTDQGQCTGWTRYHRDFTPSSGNRIRATEFNADGLAVLEKDALGRCTKSRPVVYALDPRDVMRPNLRRPLLQQLGSEIVRYEYDGDRDRTGRAKRGVE